jgi:hypothetical protein
MFVRPHDTARRNAIGPVCNRYDGTEWQTWKMSKQTYGILRGLVDPRRWDL